VLLVAQAWRELPIGFGVVNATSEAISVADWQSIYPCCPVMTLVPANKHTDKSSGLEQINKDDEQMTILTGASNSTPRRSSDVQEGTLDRR